tara:strand:+ start:175 stop:324 length:150 start_codon:yes stop_codon:yes gene_type:complete
MKKDKGIPSEIDRNSWDKMVDFTEEFGHMILYLSVFCIVLMIINKDTMV